MPIDVTALEEYKFDVVFSYYSKDFGKNVYFTYDDLGVEREIFTGTLKEIKFIFHHLEDKYPTLHIVVREIGRVPMMGLSIVQDEYDDHQPDEQQEWHDFDPDC